MNLDELNAIIGNVRDVVETLRVVRTRIENNASTYNRNETNTRNGLINPVLEGLGWDVTDPAMVLAEHPMGGGRVDYALKVDEAPIAVVEAKHLGSRLGADVTAQVLNYISDDPTVKYAIATNGNYWQMQIRGERKLTVDRVLTDAQEYETALELMKISRQVLIDSMDSGTNDRTVEDRSSTGNSSYEDVNPEVMQSGASHDGWVAFDQLEFKGKSPDCMMLPDGKQIPTRSWKAIWLTLAEWITDRHRFEGEILFGKNPKYMAIRTENVGFWPGFGEQLPNGYWVIGGTLNTSNVRRCTRALLDHCGYDRNAFKFRFN